VDSLRVRWVPLVQSFHRLGAFAFSPHPGVRGSPALRLLTNGVSLLHTITLDIKECNDLGSNFQLKPV